jgi:O-antigen ligase
VGKNILLNYKAETKTNVAIACALAMLAGFLLSRVLLSAATIAFGINALLGVHPREWLKNKWWLLGVAWVGIYLLSGLWSEGFRQWSYPVSVKLPVLLLPLAFGLLPRFSAQQLTVFTIGGALLFLGSMGYSLYFLATDPDYYIEQYSFSKVLPTLAGHDYIRYSLSIALFIIWCFYIRRSLTGKWAKWLVAFTIIVLCLHIHIVAVKTGLLVLYLFFFCQAIYIAFSRKLIIGLGIIAIMAVTAISAYKYVPTFEQKVNYFRYSWKVFEHGNFDSDYSDIGRLISYDITLKLLPDYLAAGTGIGDLHDVMKEGYRKWYPKVPEFQQLKPHNQFLIVALGCGIPALLIFLAWVLYPLRWVRNNRHGFFVFTIWLVMLVPLMVEPFLELQFGVYVYLFFMLWMVHNAKSNTEVVQ